MSLKNHNTEILSPSPAHIKRAAELIKQGELIGMPTETVYGLAGHGLKPESLALIFETKERPTFDPLILHISPSMLPRLGEWGELESKKIPASLWPGPLTILFKKKSIIPDLATSGLIEVAIRMPNHPVAIALIDAVGAPLAAPSANLFGSISPTTAEHVMKELGGRIPLILDGGATTVGVESTVIRMHADKIEILRPGGITSENLSKVTGLKVELANNPHASLSASPGTLENHYAPSTRMLMIPKSMISGPIAEIRNWVWEQKKKFKAKSTACILMSERHKHKYDMGGAPLFDQWFSLSKKGADHEVALSLFATLRQADESRSDLLFVEPVTVTGGLWTAIEDRIKKASTKQ